MINYIGEKLAKFLGEDVDMKCTSPTNEAAADFMKFNSISEILPYFTYDEQSKIFINKHSYGFVLEVSPLIGFTAKIELELAGLFKTVMPAGSNLQFLMFASPKVGAKIDSWEEARSSASEVLKNIAKRRAEFFKSFAFSSSKMRDFRVFVSCSFEQKGVLNEFHKKELRELREAVLGVFETIGLNCAVMDPKESIPVLNSIVAPKRDLYYKPGCWNKVAGISDQISYSDTSLQVKQNGLLVDEGEFLVRSYTAVGFPDEWYLGGMDLLIGDTSRDLLQIECPFMISYGINFVEEASLEAKLTAKGARVESQASSPLAKWLPGLVRQAHEWRFVREQIGKKERLVRTSFQVALFSNMDNIARDEQRLMSLYRGNGFELASNRYTHLPCIVSMLPMSWGAGMSYDMVAFKKSRITLSHEPINLLPIQGEWRGTESPGMLLTSRKGQLFSWSPFDNKSGNFNVCFVGQSGKGKSFSVQMLLESILGTGGRAFVLDLGRSYEKFCNHIGGNHLVFSGDNNICINPFSSIPTGSGRESQDALTMLKSIIALMAAPQRGVSDIENSFLEKAIATVWEKKGTKATMTDVIIALENLKDVRTKDLSIMLYPYGEAGGYGDFFEGEANINFDNSFNVIELEELKQRKDLQAVVFQIFILQITNKMFLGDRKVPFCIVFEEFWDFLKGKQSVDFIEALGRLVRRFYGSLISVTQNVSDFYRNDGARAVFENSDWMCMLSQKPESIEQLKKAGKFLVTEHMENMLNSLKTKGGHYAEMMIKGSDGYAIGRLMADPFSKILYSSKAQEYSRVKDLQKQGLTLQEAVMQTAQEVFGGDGL